MKECMILKDLFPLYQEELLQEETTKILREHMEECPNCKVGYEQFCQGKKEKEEREEEEEIKKERKFLKLLRRYRRHFFITIGALSLVVVTLFTVLVLFVTLILTGGWAKRSRNIADYPEILEEGRTISTEYLVFPKSISEGMKDITFDFYFQDTFGSPTLSVFLQATYPEEEYEAEVNRLRNLRKIYDNGKKKLIQDEEKKYPYPAFIAVDNFYHTYEYALLTGENQITYICTRNFMRNNIRFDKGYLPLDFMEEEELGSTYTIYERAVPSIGTYGPDSKEAKE